MSLVDFRDGHAQRLAVGVECRALGLVDQLAEALRNLNQHAKRQPRAIKLFTADPPTKWDLAHDRVNDLLTLMDLA